MIYNSIVVFLVLFHFKYHNVRKMMALNFLCVFKYKFYSLNGKKWTSCLVMLLTIYQSLNWVMGKCQRSCQRVNQKQQGEEDQNTVLNYKIVLPLWDPLLCIQYSKQLPKDNSVALQVLTLLLKVKFPFWLNLYSSRTEFDPDLCSVVRKSQSHMFPWN